MSDNKNSNCKCKNKKKYLNTDKIEGKIGVPIPDERERRDGPGGN